MIVEGRVTRGISKTKSKAGAEEQKLFVVEGWSFFYNSGGG